MPTVEVYRLLSTVYRLPSTVYRLPPTVYRLPSTVYRLPPTVYCLLSSVYRLLHLMLRYVSPLRVTSSTSTLGRATVYSTIIWGRRFTELSPSPLIGFKAIASPSPGTHQVNSCASEDTVVQGVEESDEETNEAGDEIDFCKKNDSGKVSIADINPCVAVILTLLTSVILFLTSTLFSDLCLTFAVVNLTFTDINHIFC